MNKGLMQVDWLNLDHEFDDENISIINKNFQSFIEEVYKVFVA